MLCNKEFEERLCHEEMKVYAISTSCQNYDHCILSTEKKEEEEEVKQKSGLALIRAHLVHIQW